MPPVGAKAKAKAKPSAVPDAVNAEPEFKFDPAVQELVLDVKGLCGLPCRPMVWAVRSLRALVMPKGKFVHVPKLAGKYVVLGIAQCIVKHGLIKVHFREEFQRPPELLTNFLDHGVSDDGMNGIMVESFLLPLKVQQGVYQAHPRYAPEAEVAGFSKIGAAEAKELEPFLKRIDQFVMNGIKGEDSMLTYIAKPVADRLDELHTQAISVLEATRDKGLVQDSDAQNEFEERLSALNLLVADMKLLPMENYDAPLATRITEIELLNPPAHHEIAIPAWLTSPLRKELEEGKAEGNATRLLGVALAGPHGRRPPSPVPRRSPRNQGGAGPSAGAGLLKTSFTALSDLPSDDDEDVHDSGLVDDLESDEIESESAVSPPPAARSGSKRNRKQVDRHVPPPTAMSKAKAVKAAPKAKAPKAKAPRMKVHAPSGNDEQAPFGMSASSGKPYKRPCGAYRGNMERIIDAVAPKAAPTSAPTASMKELNDLREKNRELQTKLDILTAKSENAEKMGLLASKAEQAEKMLEQFQAGLERGLALVGHRIGPPASASMNSM
jgi:hypothetical protein